MRKYKLEEALRTTEADRERLRIKVEQLKFGPSDLELRLKAQLKATREELAEAEAVIRELSEWAERSQVKPGRSIAEQEFHSIINAPREDILRMQGEAREKAGV